MPTTATKLAVYTTIYPAVRPYIAVWYDSICKQTDLEFELWIGLDCVTRHAVKELVGRDIEAKWVESTHGSTPAQIRQQALAEIVEVSSEVVLVDSDDLLHPTRVAAARVALRSGELAGCALRLVDQQAKSLDLTFTLPAAFGPNEIFPRNNAFGFSNSAYRAELLKRVLPIPSEAVLVDWFIATRAWLLGAKIEFDREARMDYRQYPQNMALVRPPFTAQQVAAATALVRQHFRLVLQAPLSGSIEGRYLQVERTANDVEEFSERIISDPIRLAHYVTAYNSLDLPQIWWSCVANPALSHLWKDQRD